MAEIEGRPGLDDLVKRETGDIDLPEGAEVTFNMVPPPWAIRFTDAVGREVGALTFDKDGRLTFAGNADEAAQIFFNVVIATNNEEVRRFSLAQELLIVAKCPNAHCVDGTIQEGFGDAYDTFECQFCGDRRTTLASAK